ncbi:GATA zinc finger domain-containing protein 10 [Pseudocercospora fuligena]|uniref:GATA zinc finger domain-containing protein 10 n=1 Tax=Pseudocercospora fuligena TaxID=685502 RepID=A0A8H6RUP7_9PEZI|nr:GATA zinc finger domain-containing protein 10 [Pseudocercospora fuligena]
MDPSRRPQLPAISYLADSDKVKREDDVYQNRHAGTGTPQSLSASAGASPTYHYPQAPPAPYGHAHGVPPTNTWPSASAGVHTPPESRWTSENDKEGAKQRQSLPSISEALGIDRQTSLAADPPPPLQPTHLTQTQATAPSSPTPSARRSFPMEPPQGSQPPYSTTSSTFSQYSHYRSESQQPSYPPPSEASRPAPAAYPPVTESKPPLQLQTSQPTTRPPPSTTFARPAEPSPAYEQPNSTSAGSMGPPSSFPYGYTPYPPRYANPTPPSSTASGPIYQPSVYSAPQATQPTWKTADRSDERSQAPANYGDSVKRHLDFYDLEAALNDIAANSGILCDFSRRYGDRMHQTQRSGATLKTLPGIVEVDDMINKSRVAHDALMKIRDVIIQQQAAYEQQAADQRQQHKTFDPHPPQPEHHEQQVDDSKTGGFGGVDTKKRRGRAAPPGRCHSCNRAETPEWRRGPDGARTLCNACGLHYAKLTRKNNGTNKTTNVGSSNLRPKENMA